MRKFYRALMSSIALMVMFVLGMSSASAIPDAPPSVIPVVDESNTLDAQSLMAIGKIANIDNSDVKVYTYIVPELPDEYANIDEAARETLNAWGLSNSGVLIYIAKADGEISVQVGERWQEALSNDMERIISETIIPSLSEDNYSGALTSGISEIKQAAGSDSPSAANQMLDRLLTILVIVFAVMLFPLVIAFIVKLLRGKKDIISEPQAIPSTTSTNETFVKTVPQRVAKDTKEKMRDSIEELQMSNPALFYAVLDEVEKEKHNDTDNDGVNSSIDEHTTNYDSDSNSYSSSSYESGSDTYNSYSSVYDSPSYSSYSSSSYNSDFGSSYSSSYSSDFGSSDSGGSDSGSSD